MDVTYTLQSRQRLDAETTELTQSGKGSLTPIPGGWRLRWDDPPEAGLGKTRAELTLHPGEATLTRTGETVSRMAFRPGETHTSPYRTLYGDLPMTLLTRTVDWDMDDHGGTVRLAYALTLAGQNLGETQLTVTVRKAEKTGAAGEM